MKNTKTNRHIDNLKVTVVGFTIHETPRRAVVFLLTMKADPMASADSWRIWRGRNTFNDKILGPLMAKTRDEVWWIPSGDGIMTHVQSMCVESFQLFIRAFGWNLQVVNLKTACFQTWSILEQDHATTCFSQVCWRSNVLSNKKC